MRNGIFTFLSILLFCGQYAHCSSYSEWTIENSKGQTYEEPNGLFKTYAVPAEYPHMSGAPRFNVSVNNYYVGLFNDNNFWGGNVAFGSFDFDDGQVVDVEIASRTSIEAFEILPKSVELEDVYQSTDKSIHLKIKKADQQLTLIINDEYTKDVLHLFCNSIDKDAPVVDAPNGYKYDVKQGIHYFGPGYYDLDDYFANGTLSVRGNKKIYLAGGAVVDGQLAISGGNGAQIYGRGLLMNAEPKVVASISQSENCDISGIMIHGHRAQCWCTVVDNSNKINFENVKIITTRYASTDGLDINHCSDCNFHNMFIRSCDDAVAIKGLSAETNAPVDCPANKNLIFTEMKLWNDCNNAFGMGAETRASVYENIQLRDSEILFSYDDPNNHEQLDERSTMNICALHGTYFKNILFENIYVHKCERLIGLGFKSDFWFGSIPGDQTYPGGIDGVTFRNITSPRNSGSSIANQIHLYGWHKDGTPNKFVENILFDNVMIEGELLNGKDSRYIVTNNTPEFELVRSLHFENSSDVKVVNKNKEISLYPTSVHVGTPVKIVLDNADEQINWTVYSMNGQSLLSGTNSSVSTDTLSPSIYLIRIETDGRHTSNMKFQIK